MSCSTIAIRAERLSFGKDALATFTSGGNRECGEKYLGEYYIRSMSPPTNPSLQWRGWFGAAEHLIYWSYLYYRGNL